MMVQLIMSTGGWIRVPLVLSSLSLSLALWLMLRRVVRDLRGTISPGLDLLAGAEAFLVPMALIGIDPHMGGDTIMFIAANIGYMWGLALGVAAILLLWSQRGPNVKHGWVLWAAVLLSFVASVHHELNALGAVGAVVAMALITPAGKWTVRWAAALAVTAVGNIARMGMPGLWARSLRLGGPYPYPKSVGELPKRVSFVIHSVSHWFAGYPALFFAIMVSVGAMSVVAMKRGYHRRTIGILLTLFCMAFIGLAATSMRIVVVLTRRKMSGDIDLYLSTTGLLAGACFGVVAVTLLVLTVMIARIPGCGMVGVATGAALGYYAMPVFMGSPGGRTSFMGLAVFSTSALVWAWGAVGLAMDDTTSSDAVSEPGAQPEAGTAGAHGAGSRATTVLAIVVTASCLATGLQGVWDILQGATVNGGVWRTVNAEVDSARRGERTTVIVPKVLPAPDWLPDYAGARESATARLHQYLDLPKGVTVVRR